MIKLRNRISQVANVISSISMINASLDEIESMFNRIAVSRSAFSEPVADYFRFDPANGKLYLDTIEGKTYEIAVTEI
jgi:hypothetical protein